MTSMIIKNDTIQSFLNCVLDLTEDLSICGKLILVFSLGTVMLTFIAAIIGLVHFMFQHPLLAGALLATYGIPATILIIAERFGHRNKNDNVLPWRQDTL